MLTKRRTGLLKLAGVRLSVIAIPFIVYSIVKLGWSTADNQSGRSSDWNTQNLKIFRGFMRFEGMDKFIKNPFSTFGSSTSYGRLKLAHFL